VCSPSERRVKMTWEILLGLITVCGFLFTLCTLVFKLSKTLTTLEAAVTAFTEFKSDSKVEHKEMHDKLEDYEKRIQTIEIKIDNDPNN
jgi:hypothetical protein